MEMQRMPQNFKIHNTEIHTVVQREATKSSSFNTMCLLLVVCLVITVIAVVAVSVLTALYLKKINDEKDTSSPTPSTTLDLIQLDISSLNSHVFASSNRTMISNTFFDGAIAGPGKRPLMNYYGVLADRSILKGEQLDIRFKVKYKIIQKPTSDLLIFDFAMCSLCSVDKHWYGGKTGMNCWDMNVSVHKNIGSIKLYFQDNGKFSSNEHFISSPNVGTTKTVSYDIHVSGRTSSISYNDLSAKHFNTYNNVNFSQPLYVLFGLYNPKYFQTVFQIL